MHRDTGRVIGTGRCGLHRRLELPWCHAALAFQAACQMALIIEPALMRRQCRSVALPKQTLRAMNALQVNVAMRGHPYRQPKYGDEAPDT